VPEQQNTVAVNQTYLTAVEVAELLRVSPKTVSRWSLEDSSMPATRIGRTVRFEREALLAWVRRHQPRRITQRSHNEPTPAA
jgi:excisionase family DNA binding protein